MGEAMMSAVRISVATVARRGRIALGMGILTPAVDGAGSCVRDPARRTVRRSPWPSRGRSWVFASPPVLVVLPRVTCGSRRIHVHGPARGRTRPTLGRRRRTHGAGEGTDGGSVGRCVNPTGGRRHPATRRDRRPDRGGRAWLWWAGGAEGGGAGRRCAPPRATAVRRCAPVQGAA